MTICFSRYFIVTDGVWTISVSLNPCQADQPWLNWNTVQSDVERQNQQLNSTSFQPKHKAAKTFEDCQFDLSLPEIKCLLPSQTRPSSSWRWPTVTSNLSGTCRPASCPAVCTSWATPLSWRRGRNDSLYYVKTTVFTITKTSRLVSDTDLHRKYFYITYSMVAIASMLSFLWKGNSLVSNQYRPTTGIYNLPVKK